MDLGASGRTWAVATPHALATEAAAVAFERGGNAVDAALAAATTLAVVYPHMCGVGGDLFALVQHPAGDVVAINASGRAPAGADPAAAAAEGGGRMPEHGPLSVTVPGAVSGWHALHGQGANLSWADAFTAAVAYAHGGVNVARSLAAELASDRQRLSRDQGLAEVFFPLRRPAAAIHEQIRQPALGATLQVIAGAGPSAWYGGEAGERYVEGLRALGVPIDLADMAGHRADLGTPLRGRYRDVDVLVPPPNSQGFLLLETLLVLERLRIDPDPLGPDAGALAHVFWAAARDRDLHLADADAMRLHPSTLLDDGHLGAVGDTVREGLPAAPGPVGGSGDTIALVTADAEGRGVSLIQSLFDGFGSGLLEPATGVVAQNRGACFTLEPGHPNALAGGKRPAHTLMPVVWQRSGRLQAVAGTMGGYAQPQIDAEVLIRAVDLAMPPDEAVAAPRWIVGGSSETGAPSAVAEADVGAQVLDRLAGAGFRVETVAERDGSVGHAQLILTASDGFDAGSDPRADGGAAAS